MKREDDVVGVIAHLSLLVSGEPKGTPEHARRIKLAARIAFDLSEEYRLDHERVSVSAYKAAQMMAQNRGAGTQ